ncbi:glycosyltransferase family protein [Fulvivirgaceae bacterium BMA12]|uniref:Glycosyltransferase family protein n=1 Tax=Agaribacillus aureus TaxID=3051825 RepID=A0ABT8LFZ0_9BACT|nr:glycosyltransferase family protein [Fulvivirgaceae bacterium BMA12]
MKLSNLNIGIISQARMTSSRLPGKILFECKGVTILEHHINRLRASDVPVFVATTTNATDDPVIDTLLNLDIPYFRGDEQNVLSRYYYTALENNLDLVIRVTSDCPLIDGLLIKKALEDHLKSYSKNLYTSNCIERSYPRGFDFEIFSFELLKEAFDTATLPSDLEHVTPYIHQNKSGNVLFNSIRNFEDKSGYRVTLDTTDDWKLISKLINDYNAEDLGYLEIIKLLDVNKDLALINAHVEQKKVE